MINPCSKCDNIGNCGIYKLICNSSLSVFEIDSKIRNLTANTTLIHFSVKNGDTEATVECSNYEPNKEEAKKIRNERRWSI